MERKSVKISGETYNKLKEIQEDIQLSSISKTIDFLVKSHNESCNEGDVFLLKTILREVQEIREIWNVYLNNTLVADNEYKDEEEHKFITIAKQLNEEKNKKNVHRNKLNKQ